MNKNTPRVTLKKRDLETLLVCINNTSYEAKATGYIAIAGYTDIEAQNEMLEGLYKNISTVVDDLALRQSVDICVMQDEKEEV